MNVCSRPECQTTAGCAHRGPRMEMCWFPAPPMLGEYSDDEIAKEYFRRKLGNPVAGLMSGAPSWTGPALKW